LPQLIRARKGTSALGKKVASGSLALALNQVNWLQRQDEICAQPELFAAGGV